MRRLSLVFTSILLVSAMGIAAPQKASNPCGKKAQNPCNPCAGKSAKVKSGKRTIVGFIGDSQCGLEHPMDMGDAKACTLKCVEGGGKFILADRENKVVYQLDLNKDAQEKARQFAGQKVKVTGNVNAKTKTIKVTSIEAAS